MSGAAREVQVNGPEDLAAIDRQLRRHQRKEQLKEDRVTAKRYLELCTAEFVKRLQSNYDKLSGTGQDEGAVDEQMGDSEDNVEEVQEGDPPAAIDEVELPSAVLKLLSRLTFPKKSIASLTKQVQFFRVMEEMSKSLSQETMISKRDLYYSSPALFKYQQSVVDRIIDEISDIFGLRRSTLGVIATSKGLIVGDAVLRLGSRNDSQGEEGQIMSVSHTRETLIPDVDIIEDVSSQAKWILIVEKDAVFKTLVNHKLTKSFHQIGNGILITGKGYPDLITKEFVLRLTEDCPSFGINQADLIPLARADHSRARSMLKSLEEGDQLRQELAAMLESGHKAELECLSSSRRQPQDSSSDAEQEDGLVSYVCTKLSDRLSMMNL
ncbi:unnamed protein product [Sympodiomycopsis kandeliae]